MATYFLRRLLLVIPTFLGITLAVFVITHFVPGGPVERRIMQIQMAAMAQGGVTAAGRVTTSLPEEAIEEIRRYWDRSKRACQIEWPTRSGL